MKKRILNLALVLMLLGIMFVLTGCGEKNSNVDTDSKTSSAENDETEPNDEGLKASNIASNPNEYYGKYVNYETSNTLNEEYNWEIFYADEENIYLIADDYILANDAPLTIDGKSVAYDASGVKSSHSNEGDFPYAVELYTNISGYTGSEWIKSNTNKNAQKWLSFLQDDTGSTLTYNNVKAIAYLMDTDSWTEKFAGTGCDWVIGGATIDLFSASYNAIHDVGIDYQILNKYGYGYQLKWNTDDTYNQGLTGLNTEENLYIITSTEKADMMELAAIQAIDNYALLCITSEGNIVGAGVQGQYAKSEPDYGGLRPVICLSSEAELVENADGSYDIVIN